MDDELLWIGLGALLVVAAGGGIVVYQRYKTKADFFKLLGPVAAQLEKETGKKAAVSLTQAALESNYGKSKLSNDYHNYFGLKPPRVTTESIKLYPQLALWASRGQAKATFNTKEEIGGQMVTISDQFMSFPDDISCFRYWSELLDRLYPLAASAARDGDIKDFGAGLKMGIGGAQYATESNYGSDLIAFNKDVQTSLA